MKEICVEKGCWERSPKNIEQGSRNTSVSILFANSALPSNNSFERAVGLQARPRRRAVRWPCSYSAIKPKSLPDPRSVHLPSDTSIPMIGEQLRCCSGLNDCQLREVAGHAACSLSPRKGLQTRPSSTKCDRQTLQYSFQPRLQPHFVRIGHASAPFLSTLSRQGERASDMHLDRNESNDVFNIILFM